MTRCALWIEFGANVRKVVGSVQRWAHQTLVTKVCKASLDFGVHPVQVPQVANRSKTLANE